MEICLYLPFRCHCVSRVLCAVAPAWDIFHMSSLPGKSLLQVSGLLGRNLKSPQCCVLEGFSFWPPVHGDLGLLVVASCISFFNTSVSHFANTLLSQPVTCGLDLKPDFSCCIEPSTLNSAFDRALPMQVSLPWNTSHFSGAAVNYLNTFGLFLRTVSSCNLK